MAAVHYGGGQKTTARRMAGWRVKLVTHASWVLSAENGEGDGAESGGEGLDVEFAALRNPRSRELPAASAHDHASFGGGDERPVPHARAGVKRIAVERDVVRHGRRAVD